MKRCTLSMLAVALAAASGAAPRFAFAADPLAVTGYEGVCSDQRFLHTIESRFRYQVTHVPHLPDVAIENFYNIREVRFEPTDDRHPISRQYCEADVLLSDGRSRDIWYLIETDLGFASIGDNVEFCVSGFDRWHVYNGNCRVLQ